MGLWARPGAFVKPRGPRRALSEAGARLRPNPWPRRVRRTILHIGADKCGSTSIQAYLSRRPVLSTASGSKKLFYACLHEEGLLLGEAIQKHLGRSISASFKSRGLQPLRQLNERDRALIARQIRSCRSDLILSCEGWLRSFARRDALDLLLEILTPRGVHRAVELIAFVRPPVGWINSAWWQWGAWEWEGAFDDWLSGAIQACCWERCLEPVRSHPGIQRLQVEPVRGDVVVQLQRLLAIDVRSAVKPAATAGGEGVGGGSLEVGKDRSNVSLPAEALHLYQRFRDLRPGPHTCRSDYLILPAVARNASAYRPTPWVLRPEHIERILAETRESNTRLLDLLDPTARLQMLDDPLWWHSEAYADKVASEPFDAAAAGPLNYEQFAYDLLRQLGLAVRVLESHDLADVYQRAARAAAAP